MSKTFLERLKELGYDLPTPPTAKGAYLPVREAAGFYYTSGTGANINGTRYFTGKVGETVSLEDAVESGRLALLNNLANLYAVLGERINDVRIMKLTGYVNCTPDFQKQAAVIDGASRLLEALFGEEGRHARCAIGVSSLPFNLSTEIEMVCYLKCKK